MSSEVRDRPRRWASPHRCCFLPASSVKPDYPLFIGLPGLDGTGKLWQDQLRDLSPSFDGRCLAIPVDHRGSWEDLVGEAIALIETELAGQQRTVYLCGESFGACLAMKVAVAAPQLVDRLILINPASGFREQLWLNWGGQLLDFVPELFFRLGAVGFLPFLANLSRLAPDTRRYLLEIIQSVPPKTILWRLSLLRAFAIDPQKLQQFQPPVLLIAGGSDRLLPSVTEVERLSRCFPNVQKLILPHSGHACLLETDINLYEIIQSQNFTI